MAKRKWYIFVAGCMFSIMIQFLYLHSKLSKPMVLPIIKTIVRKPTILVGVLITDSVPSSRIDAYRKSLEIFQNQNNSYSDIRLIFFLGQSAQQGQFLNKSDIIRGNFPENMNNGKSFEWLKTAVTWFRSYRGGYNRHDMVVKMDTDTTVNWKALDEKIRTFSTPVYFGVRAGFIKCGMHPHCPPKSCEEKLDFSDACWMYMQGGFYGISMDIVHELVSVCPVPSRDPSGHEDLLIGLWIKKCGIQVNIVGANAGEVFCHSTYMPDERIVDYADYACNK